MIGGDLRVTGNEVLSEVEVEDLLEQLGEDGVGGTVEVGGNGDG